MESSTACLLVTVALLSTVVLFDLARYSSPPPTAALVSLTHLTPGPAAFLHPSRHFTSNIFLRAWDGVAFDAAARSLVEFRATAVRDRVEGLGGVRGHRGFAPPPLQPCAVKRYGDPAAGPDDQSDGGKFLCDLPALSAMSSCVVYSLGSMGDMSFEDGIVARTACEVHTFDCTLAKDPVPSSPRIHFHPLCAGDGAGDPRYLPLAALAARLNHTTIHLLKMDIEGFEYRVVESLYGDALRGVPGAALMLPMQISLEVHAASEVPGLPKLAPPGLSASEMDALWVPLTELGYVVVSREDNSRCTWCVEFTVVRAFL